ncbi:MAG: aspartate kinase [Gammaproteobacteria bacterium]
MALFVQKFGGTSMGSLERIQAVADIIINSRQQGHQVVAVVSAISGETDRLIHLAKSAHEQPHPREYDTLVSTGEQVSMALLAIILNARGHPARSHTGWQAGIKTSDVHQKARILDIEVQTIQAALDADEIPIIAGFQGINDNGDITTLGRGGSDTTGVALAAALKADECQIYTDVDGVYTADPRVVTQARHLAKITFEEMLELASLGAKVLQIRAVEFAGKYRVPLRVLSSFTAGPGTLITFEEKTMEQPLVSGIALNRHEAKLTIMGVPEGPGIAANILNPISHANIDVDVIVQNIAVDGRIDFTFTVQRDDYQKAFDILKDTADKIGARDVVGDTRIAKLSAVGMGMKSHVGIASKMFQVLGKEGINIQLISTSEIKISVIIDEKYLELGARALHAAFGLDKS